MKTFLDWSAYDTYGVGDAYSGIPATGGNYAKAVAVCMHSRDCQKTGKGVMCPSFRVTGEARHSTEARVAAFKAALNEGSGAAAFADPRLDDAMDLCVSCKACKKECPSAVDMTLIKTEYLAQRHEIEPPSLRLRLFGGAPVWLARHGTLLRLAIKAHNRLPPLARLVEHWLGVTARRPMPEPAAKAFSARPREPAATRERGAVVLFVDTFCQHFEPEIAEAAIAVLEHAGYAVRIARPAASDPEPERPLCCGRTYLTTGLVEKARGEAEARARRFSGRDRRQDADHRPGALLPAVVARRALQPRPGTAGRRARQAALSPGGVSCARAPEQRLAHEAESA